MNKGDGGQNLFYIQRCCIYLLTSSILVVFYKEGCVRYLHHMWQAEAKRKEKINIPISKTFREFLFWNLEIIYNESSWSSFSRPLTNAPAQETLKLPIHTISRMRYGG